MKELILGTFYGNPIVIRVEESDEKDYETLWGQYINGLKNYRTPEEQVETFIKKLKKVE